MLQTAAVLKETASNVVQYCIAIVQVTGDECLEALDHVLAASTDSDCTTWSSLSQIGNTPKDKLTRYDRLLSTTVVNIYSNLASKLEY